MNDCQRCAGMDLALYRKLPRARSFDSTCAQCAGMCFEDVEATVHRLGEVSTEALLNELRSRLSLAGLSVKVEIANFA